MTIQSAIAALAPRNYWPLSETTGGFYQDLGSTPNAMQWINDTTGVGAVGPEVGSHAYRVFSGGSASTSGMGITAFGSFSVLLLTTAPANGLPQSYVTFAGLGDVNNPTTHGLQIQQFSNAAQGLTYQGRGTNNGTLLQVPWPQSFWHVLAWTFNGSTNLLQGYIDTTVAQSGTAVMGTAPVSSDTFYIKSTSPIVVAHLAYWPRVLSQAEVNTVANQVQTWPYGEPINVPVQGQTGPVTISPTDTVTQQILSNQGTFMPEIANINTVVPQIHTQTTTMETNWSNYTSVTLPSLNDSLNGILSAVTSTITGAAGAVSKTIGDLFSGKTFDLITTLSLGSACAPAVIDSFLDSGTFFGLQMECTSHADWYVFTGSADDYTTQALGTLQIFRGGSEVLRLGLHTLTHTVYPLPGVPLVGVETAVPWVPGNYEVKLTPAPETCWSLVALQFP